MHDCKSYIQLSLDNVIPLMVGTIGYGTTLPTLEISWIKLCSLA